MCFPVFHIQYLLGYYSWNSFNDFAILFQGLKSFRHPLRLIPTTKSYEALKEHSGAPRRDGRAVREGGDARLVIPGVHEKYTVGGVRESALNIYARQLRLSKGAINAHTALSHTWNWDYRRCCDCMGRSSEFERTHSAGMPSAKRDRYMPEERNDTAPSRLLSFAGTGVPDRGGYRKYHRETELERNNHPWRNSCNTNGLKLFPEQ